VALRLLPSAVRRDLRALYDFARLVDELGDAALGDRLARLDAMEAGFRAALDGRPPTALLGEVARSVRRHRLPAEPFLRLIEANRRDQLIHRYASWGELREYCSFSAEPVGHLVLWVFGAASAERIALSDDVCTALQLLEHCQDVAEDRAAGRLYLPAEDLERFGCSEAELDGRRASLALRRTLAFQVARARRLLERGDPLVAGLRGAARLAVAGYVAGGRAAADGLERIGFDVLAHSARSRRRDLLRHLLPLWLWRGWRRSG